MSETDCAVVFGPCNKTSRTEGALVLKPASFQNRLKQSTESGTTDAIRATGSEARVIVALYR